MNIPIMLAAIEEYIITSNNLKPDDGFRPHIVSMYQDITNESIFMLKSSEQAAHYAELAVAKKPALIITDIALAESSIPVVVVSDFAAVANQLIRLLYDDAISRLKFIAVTGTNGKTTTSHMIAKLLTCSGQKTGIIGTLGIFDCHYHKLDFNHSTQTTPMYFELAEIIKYFAEEAYDYIVYEATSIALDQQRTDFISNDLAVFTNFSPEHLEYHGTMASYLQAKLRLDALSKDNIVNMDTREYHSLAQGPFHFSSNADTYYQFNLHDDYIDLKVGSEQHRLYPSFFGEHNYINISTSVFALHKLGFPINQLLKYAGEVQPPVHRFEVLDIQGYEFILDFAHTPVAVNESIHNALKYAARQQKNLNVMVTGIGLRGFDKIMLTVKQLPPGVHQLMLAAEQVGYVEPETIMTTMIDHLTDCYNSDHVLSSPSRKEGISQLIKATDPAEDIILLTGINEPQHFRGSTIEHDDQQYIKQLLCDH
ncbi:Mur ligase family protein [Macrococcus equipercicus]|uniref:UDP-N-acetylmuramoylalanyl-D-glutamate--2, 6-diaminopimelate ligase n=1 Tax=Macrococcus equipercicus TaxID=69967 RepID=A0A9Q9BW48_9STAP|nr:Mur ligase family protein [Macrococcus equipercicus]UTH14108.1 UDP-N-acetylmuramoylalanyl-D-glutamate--2,6-diaminopimelate ligase [Macrococcus equipercicus]